ncbi:MAG: type 1 glutamine amidotransferase domain-containing protein [Syntrophobacteraceae bacterium]
MSRVLMPLPGLDFDPTESAGSWLMLTEAGHRVQFATPDGRPGAADDIMLTGRGLDFWGFIPGLRNFTLLGKILGASRQARDAYHAMEQSHGFQNPQRWQDIQTDDYDALLLPGGHRARGMRRYLESAELQRIVLGFFLEEKPVAAICHGVLLAARTIDPATGRSVLYGRKTTALTWALEHSGMMAGRIGRFWDPNYYRTYLEKPGQPTGYMSVQQEVTRSLAKASDFLDVLAGSSHFRVQTSGTRRDSPNDPAPAFVVRDGNYLSARWPGDVFTFAGTFAAMLDEKRV